MRDIADMAGARLEQRALGGRKFPTAACLVFIRTERHHRLFVETPVANPVAGMDRRAAG
jgi:hypothetical protein